MDDPHPPLPLFSLLLFNPPFNGVLNTNPPELPLLLLPPALPNPLNELPLLFPKALPLLLLLDANGLSVLLGVVPNCDAFILLLVPLLLSAAQFDVPIPPPPVSFLVIALALPLLSHEKILPPLLASVFVSFGCAFPHIPLPLVEVDVPLLDPHAFCEGAVLEGVSAGFAPPKPNPFADPLPNVLVLPLLFDSVDEGS